MGQVMGDLTNNERVAVEIQALSDVFEHGTKKLDTDEEFGTAFLEFILGRERIRRGVKAPGPDQNVVDCETLEVLKNAQLDDPKFAEAEATFRRLGVNPTKAMAYFWRSQTQKTKIVSERMSKVATNTRPKGQNPFAKLIDPIVAENTNITRNQLLQRLKKHEDLSVLDGKILCNDPHDEMSVGSLSQALSRSKARIRKNLKKQ